MSGPERDEAALARQLQAAADATTPRAIDVEAVLVATRTKRRARRSAIIGGTGAVAAALVVGGLVFGLQGAGLFGPTGTDASLESGAVGEPVTEGAHDRAEGGAIDPQSAAGGSSGCGATAPPSTDDATAPLDVTVEAATSARPGTSVAAEVVVTNRGDTTISGELTQAPAFIVDQADVIVWQTTGTPDSIVAIELAPGESVTLAGSFETRRCDDDDSLDEAAIGLPSLTTGTYAVRGAVEFVAAGSDSSTPLISPPRVLLVE